MKALSQDVTDEVIAGLLWMHLRVPRDASRAELQDYAHDIVLRIQTGTAETAIAEKIKFLQSDQFCGLPNMPAIRDLTRRIFSIVKQPGAVLQSAA